ncbi:F-box protein At3g07870-like isoform X2 [Mercurialis annua]|uniref:F-box protein At3g07870-like isoform X2 n=1 Tax=Mercurialis annua TaxID=3986 RepID=UPI00215F487E|nr:F-box protein At3g07870-like isoform X2 [Mercurialis annua]
MMEILQDELIAEILKRVPNQDLLRCTEVCKSWYYLLKSSFFIFRTHLPHIQASNPNPHLVISCRYLKNGKYVMSFHDDNTEEFSECHMPRHFYSKSELGIFASCNGLLLFYEPDYLLWNPSIGRSLSLPKPELKRSSGDVLSCLGFDSTTNDFKLLRILCQIVCSNRRSVVVEAEIYSLKAASWKNITHITPQYEIPYHLGFKPQCIPFVNGALHMIAGDFRTNDTGRSLVLVFDVKDEIFREIFLPQCLQNARLDALFVIAYGQSIAVVHIYESTIRNDIWVMKEYGVYDSWTNLGKVQNGEEKGIVAMFLRKNGQFMIDTGLGEIYSFDFAAQSFVDLFPDLEEMEETEEISSTSVFTYMETLALLDRGNFEDVTGAATN